MANQTNQKKNTLNLVSVSSQPSATPIPLQQPPAQCDCLISGLPASNFVFALIVDRKVRNLRSTRYRAQTNAVKQGRIVGYDSCQVADKTISSSGVIASVD
ncbi:hypothetical protein J6590_103460, partial [Homalodisca vitripennis]